jgi:hypothetical protein
MRSCRLIHEPEDYGWQASRSCAALVATVVEYSLARWQQIMANAAYIAVFRFCHRLLFVVCYLSVMQ